MPMHLLRGGIDLVAAHVLGGVDHLALEVGEVDHVEIHEPDLADASRGQVEAERSAEAAGAHQQHLGGFQFLLPLDADLGNDQVAAVAQDFVLGEGDFLRRRGHAGTAGNRRHQGDGVAFRGGGGVLAEVAYVFVVEVDVDEAAQLAFVGEDLLAQFRMSGDQGVQHFAYGGSGCRHRIQLAGELAQRGGDQNFGHVSKSAPLFRPPSGRRSAANCWRDGNRPFEWIERRTNTTGRNS